MLPKGDRRLKSNKDSADFHEIKTLSREFLLFAASRNLPSFVRGYHKKGWRITCLAESLDLVLEPLRLTWATDGFSNRRCRAILDSLRSDCQFMSSLFQAA